MDKQLIIESKKIIKNALKEDIGGKDITTEATVPLGMKSCAEFLMKDDGIIAGVEIAKLVFKELDKNISFKLNFNDGDFVKKGDIIAEIEGNTRAILTGERVALNLMQRMSGIATLTNKFVKIAGKIKVLDTRKTTPNLRILEKYAVHLGGGVNHRFNLNEAILIKDNHLAITGGIENAVKLARKSHKKIEVEVKNKAEIKEALKVKAERILLDNMSIREIKNAIKVINHKALVEVSGGVNLRKLKNLRDIDVDFVSVGALTHSVKSLDISLEVL